MTKKEQAQLLANPDGGRSAVINILRGIVQDQAGVSSDVRMAAARALVDLKLGYSVAAILGRFGQELGSELAAQSFEDSAAQDSHGA